MIRVLLTLLSLILIISAGCIKEFFPETTGNKNLLVVEGLITDQCGSYKINLSRSRPLGTRYTRLPEKNAEVSVTDDMGGTYIFSERTAGLYVSDSTRFTGVTGRKYTLHIITHDSLGTSSEYKSSPAELSAVPPIDSIYYKKITIQPPNDATRGIENCQIYLDTHDETGKCKYFRWDYTETWEFHLHWPGENHICWITSKSDRIIVKSTTSLAKDYVSGYPLNYIDQNSDRLEVRYSILVDQYSISQDEFAYWDKMKSFTQNVGGLYDIIPANVPGNVVGMTDPAEKVVGYFSASAKTSKRIFISDSFAGQINIYQNCPTETIYNPGDIPGLGQYLWILESEPWARPPYIILTDDYGCVDCTVRGTNVMPVFWLSE